jgi:hypothetical protein
MWQQDKAEHYRKEPNQEVYRKIAVQYLFMAADRWVPFLLHPSIF